MLSTYQNIIQLFVVDLNKRHRHFNFSFAFLVFVDRTHQCFSCPDYKAFVFPATCFSKQRMAFS